MVCGCAKKEEEVVIPNQEPVEDIEPVDTYEDDNPITVGLYMDGKLLTEYNTKIIDGVDIGVFDIYFTNESDVGNNSTKYNFNRFYSNYQDIDDYKIGFYISFDAIDGKKETTVLGPQNMYDLYYIYNYLYDDIHQADGAWYSHVEEDEVTDETIYSTIKLYAGGETDKITSPITLTVFTYNDMDDFDEDGYYRGKSKYTITINNQ